MQLWEHQAIQRSSSKPLSPFCRHVLALNELIIDVQVSWYTLHMLWSKSLK